VVARLSVKWTVRTMIQERSALSDKMAQFDHQFKPVVMGGTSAAKPWSYLEARTAYLATLQKVTSRKQVFKFAIRDNDEWSTSFLTKVILSNFFSGCRLSVASVRMAGVPIMIDHTLTRNLDSLSTDCPLLKPGPSVSFTSERVITELESGRASCLDITDYMNSMLCSENSFILSAEVRNRSIDLLQELGSEYPGCLVVRPNALSTSFQPVDYSLGRDNKLLFRTALTHDGLGAGRTFTYNYGKWQHDITLTKTDCPVPSDGPFDKFEHMDLVSTTCVTVEVKQQRGILGVYMGEDWLLQVLSLTMTEKKDYALVLNGSFSSSYMLKYLNSIGIKGRPKTLRKPSITEIMPDMGGASLAIPEETLQPVDADLVGDYEGLDYDDSDLEKDPFELMGSAWGDSEEEGDATEAQNLDFGDDSEQEESEEEREEMEPLLSQGSIAPSMAQLKQFLLGEVRYMTDEEANEHKVGRYKTGYIIELPISLSLQKFDDDDEELGLEKLFKCIEALSPVDAVWGRQQLLAMLNSFGPIMSAFRSVSDNARRRRR
jgi:hypothetical protein